MGFSKCTLTFSSYSRGVRRIHEVPEKSKGSGTPSVSIFPSYYCVFLVPELCLSVPSLRVRLRYCRHPVTCSINQRHLKSKEKSLYHVIENLQKFPSLSDDT